MGFVFSKIFSKLFGKEEMRILILGLDNAGKTTILYKLRLNEVVQTVPTIGFNLETVKVDNLVLQVWDLGGQTAIRPYWRSYYPNTNAIIYVIDSVDKERIEISKQELMMILQEEELKRAPVLILANKQDLPGAMDENQVSDYMNLTSIKERQWAIYKCSALTSFGLKESMEWLVNTIKSN
eukprot:TRINITY_DN6329_c0_g2_i1.p1 TRINITY_DN6329_c0_g2~~TRINITY_DN6329_c0_g2_i1.p1  ORF type:complete len:181 (+),score=35.53 TRINITY_DN6329_c0_g2_i1:124-666(+)